MRCASEVITRHLGDARLPQRQPGDLPKRRRLDFWAAAATPTLYRQNFIANTIEHVISPAPDGWLHFST